MLTCPNRQHCFHEQQRFHNKIYRLWILTLQNFSNYQFERLVSNLQAHFGLKSLASLAVRTSSSDGADTTEPIARESLVLRAAQLESPLFPTVASAIKPVMC